MSVNSAPYPRVIGLGTANPNTRYDQTIIADMFGHKQARIKNFSKTLISGNASFISLNRAKMV